MFLWDIETNFKSKEWIYEIIDLARQIGFVVCGGIEEQVEILKEICRELIQGYVYAKIKVRR